MMLQIDHRESRDVDIFLQDAQQLPFLDPQKRDFEFEIQPAAYEGDGTRVLKLVFDDIGEIDFIVAQTLTSSPTTPTVVEGEAILLETIPEIITKKIYHRGPVSRLAIFSTSRQQARSTKIRSSKNCEAIAIK